MGCRIKLVGVLNLISLILSVCIIGAGIWLATQKESECYKFLQMPVIVLGVFILVVSVAGLMGACCRNKCLLWIYLVVMFLLILLVIVFTIFTFIVTNKGTGQVTSNRGFKEYRLGDYSTWLQRQVNKNSNWNKIMSCISTTKVCSKLVGEYPTVDDFNKASLSPLESGCCKPLKDCGCSFVDAMTWTSCSSPKYSPDCNTYRPDPSTLCYSCDSCKAGFLQMIKDDWRRVAIVNAVVVVFLIIVYALGCGAFREMKRK